MNKTTRPFRFSKPERSFLFIAFLLLYFIGYSQNKLHRQLSASDIETISINGNQIFYISISTSKTDQITVTSSLDGEYQNEFQIEMKEENNTLKLSLEHLSLTEIPDDKRNAHKVISAILHLQIPERLSLDIISDVGTLDLKGSFNALFIELQQGKCKVIGKAKTATINTLDGDINIKTEDVVIEGGSNNGKLTIEESTRPSSKSTSNSRWKLTSINGNITVLKQY